MLPCCQRPKGHLGEHTLRGPNMTKLTEAQERWVTALESGDYKQTRGRLRDDNGFCCIGVACDVLGLGKWVSCGGWWMYTDGRREERYGLLGIVRKRLSITCSAENMLPCMNDDDGATFAEIAKWIRELSLIHISEPTRPY